jgi:16S rRNA (uracil1498-N3)-methyltransferase
MTHRFCVTPTQIAADVVTFTPKQAHQLRNVLRLRAGDTVRVFDGVVARDVLVELVEAGRGNVIGSEPQAPEPRTRLVAYPALLQRDKFETVLQKLTEIGVAAIAPVISAHSLPRAVPDATRLERWRAILREAAEQCGRGTVPSLLLALPLSTALGTSEGVRLFAYEHERDNGLPDALGSRPACVSLFTGPEGGFAPEEVECARRAGTEVITLGPRVLRAETAAPMLAALVLYELGDLSWPHDAGS